MTGIPTTSDDSQPRESSISKQTIIVSAGSKRVLAVMNGRDPLLLPPGTVLQFDDPLGELVVTRIRVIVGEGSGTVCAEAEPAPKPPPPHFSSPRRPGGAARAFAAGAEPATAVEPCAPW